MSQMQSNWNTKSIYFHANWLWRASKINKSHVFKDFFFINKKHSTLLRTNLCAEKWTDSCFDVGFVWLLLCVCRKMDLIDVWKLLLSSGNEYVSLNLVIISNELLKIDQAKYKRYQLSIVCTWKWNATWNIHLLRLNSSVLLSHDYFVYILKLEFLQRC